MWLNIVLGAISLVVLYVGFIVWRLRQRARSSSRANTLAHLSHPFHLPKYFSIDSLLSSTSSSSNSSSSNSSSSTSSSSASSPHPPPPSSSTTLSCESLFSELERRGYVLFEGTEEMRTAHDELVRAAADFFALPQEEKDKRRHPDADNMGYVLIRGVREFIKVRKTDPDHLWPPAAEFRAAFGRFFELHLPVVVAALQQIAQEPVAGARFIPPATMEALMEFLDAKSNVAVIRYFPVAEEVETCPEHIDSSILTLITRTNDPALRIVDQSVSREIEIEKEMKPGDLILFVSQKIPLYSQSQLLTPLKHRVVSTPSPHHRFSVALLLDVSK